MQILSLLRTGYQIYRKKTIWKREQEKNILKQFSWYLKAMQNISHRDRTFENIGHIEDFVCTETQKIKGIIEFTFRRGGGEDEREEEEEEKSSRRRRRRIRRRIEEKEEEIGFNLKMQSQSKYTNFSVDMFQILFSGEYSENPRRDLVVWRSFRHLIFKNCDIPHSHFLRTIIGAAVLETN